MGSVIEAGYVAVCATPGEMVARGYCPIAPTMAEALVEGGLQVLVPMPRYQFEEIESVYRRRYPAAEWAALKSAGYTYGTWIPMWLRDLWILKSVVQFTSTGAMVLSQNGVIFRAIKLSQASETPLDVGIAALTACSLGGIRGLIGYLDEQEKQLKRTRAKQRRAGKASEHE